MFIEKNDNRKKYISFDPNNPGETKKASDILLEKLGKDPNKDGVAGSPSLANVIDLAKGVGAALFLDPANNEASFFYDPEKEVEDMSSNEEAHSQVESYPVGDAEREEKSSESEEEDEDDPF